MQFYLVSSLRTLLLSWYFSRRYKNNMMLLLDNTCRPAKDKEIAEWLEATKRLMLWMGRIQPTNPIEQYLMGILISDLTRQIDVAIMLSKDIDIKQNTKGAKR